MENLLLCLLKFSKHCRMVRTESKCIIEFQGSKNTITKNPLLREDLKIE